MMYDEFSSDYDRFVNWPGRLAYEMPFIKQVLQPLASPAGHSPRALDAACGTGWHAIALSQQGWQTVGADFSAGMVEKARRNAAQKSAGTAFIQAGFGELAQKLSAASDPVLQPPFDALLCLGNSLPHILDTPLVQSALDDFNACLRPGGILLLQNRNFDLVQAQTQRWMEPQEHIDGADEYIFLRFYDFLPDGLIDFNVTTLHRHGENPWEQRNLTTRLNPLKQSHLVPALEASGFRQVTSFGDMAGNPFHPAESGNLVITAVKA